MLNQDTKRRIDAARDILVGKVPDPKAQVEQITTALIYKFMDDMDKESEELGGDASFFVGDYAKYAWSKLLDPRVGGFERLNLYTEALLKMPQNPHLPQLFRNILKDSFLPYRDPETLNLFLKEINGFTYDHSEKLGDAFEYLLSVLGSQGDAGQFRTPRHIIDFMVEVLDPKKTETILDPACGTAGFLISGYKHILKQNSNGQIGGRLTPDEKTKLMSHFMGYDISPDMIRLSLTNLYLHGFPNPNIYEYDTLTSEERWDETYDVIMANPPFMSPKGGIRPHKRFSIPANRSEVLFIDYIAEHLNTHGRAGIIVPEGIIFQSGSAYKALRKMLVEKYLYAVVSLPAGIFQPYSGVKTSILLMDRGLAKKTDSILFVKVENDGFDLGAQRRAIEKNDLAKALLILQEYKQALQENNEAHGLTDLEENSKLALKVEKMKIAKSGEYNLSGGRYKENIQMESSKFPKVELGELVEVLDSKRRPITKSDRKTGQYPYYGATGIVDFVDDYIFNERLVLVGEDGAKWDAGEKTAFIAEGKYWVNNHAHVLKPIKHKAIDNYLVEVLNYMDLNEFITGVTVPKLNQERLKQIKIPYPALEVQEEIVAELNSYQKIIDGARQVVENYKPFVRINPLWNTIKLGELCQFRNGINYTKDSSGEKIKILGVKDFQDYFYIDNAELDYITVDGELNGNDLLSDGNIVFVRSNGNQNLIGRCVLIKNVRERITHSGFTIRLILHSKEIDEVFLTYLLKTDAFREKMIEGGTGANIKSLNQGILSNLAVPLPALEVQKEIVAQLEQEQKLIDANKKLIEIFEQKIKDKIAEVWGKDIPSPTENATSMSMNSIA